MKSKAIAVFVGIVLTSGAAIAVARPGPVSTGHETDVGPPARVAAIDSAGHCVMLPETSDIIQHPAKHPDWNVIGGQCP